jgi:hypothetical protein
MLLVRERPQLRLHATISTPNGNYYRWGPDEHVVGRSSSGLGFGTTMPGGFDQAGLVLPRNPSFAYQDLQELSTVTIRGAGGRVAWQGRMESTPRTSGDQMAISPGLVGWQAHLDDDTSARMIYVDTAFGSWQGITNTRKIFLTSHAIDGDDADTGPDWSTYQPAMVLTITGAWNRQHVCEAWYDAKGLPIAALQYAWKINNLVNAGDANWSWNAGLSSDDNFSGTDFAAPPASGGLRAAGPGAGTLTATVMSRLWAAIQLNYGVAAGAEGSNYQLFWTLLGIIGTHTCPIYQTTPVSYATTPGQTVTVPAGPGVLCSDVEAHAVGTWAPKLRFSTGVNGTIKPSGFVIRQLVFSDPTTASAIIKGANQYELRDWAVWEGPTYYSNDYGQRGRKWKARVHEANLQETGPQASRLFNGVVVTFQDWAGISRTVGPPNSNANFIDATLVDPDPGNPANELGIKKWAHVEMQTGTPAAAIQTGGQFLKYQKLVDTSGQATLTGHVEDADTGVWHPAWAVRAGDVIMFPDAGDFSYRRIVKTAYDDSGKQNALQLDAPPDGMQELLERLSIVLTPTGFS